MLKLSLSTSNYISIIYALACNYRSMLEGMLPLMPSFETASTLLQTMSLVLAPKGLAEAQKSVRKNTADAKNSHTVDKN